MCIYHFCFLLEIFLFIFSSSCRHIFLFLAKIYLYSALPHLLSFFLFRSIFFCVLLHFPSHLLLIIFVVLYTLLTSTHHAVLHKFSNLPDSILKHLKKLCCLTTVTSDYCFIYRCLIIRNTSVSIKYSANHYVLIITAVTV